MVHTGPQDIRKKTLEATTQYYMNVEVENRTDLCQPLELLHYRQHKEVAINTYFSLV